MLLVLHYYITYKYIKRIRKRKFYISIYYNSNFVYYSKDIYSMYKDIQCVIFKNIRKYIHTLNNFRSIALFTCVYGILRVKNHFFSMSYNSKIDR